MVLQYMDDLLLFSPSLAFSKTHPSLLLNFLGEKGYWVSPSKAQLSLPQVKYLGFLLSPTSHVLTIDHKNHLESLQPAQLRKQSFPSWV